MIVCPATCSMDIGNVSIGLHTCQWANIIIIVDTVVKRWRDVVLLSAWKCWGLFFSFPSTDLNQASKFEVVKLIYGTVLWLQPAVHPYFLVSLKRLKTAQKPGRYASSKLCVTDRLTGVKSRATSVARNNQCQLLASFCGHAPLLIRSSSSLFVNFNSECHNSHSTASF